jgi:hypothetical protein
MYSRAILAVIKNLGLDSVGAATPCYTKPIGVIFMKRFSGNVKVKIEQGMKVRVNPNEFEGKRHAGKEFIVAGEPRDLCGTEVVALNNIEGTRFSAAYDLSMLQVTDTATV